MRRYWPHIRPRVAGHRWASLNRVVNDTLNLSDSQAEIAFFAKAQAEGLSFTAAMVERALFAEARAEALAFSAAQTSSVTTGGGGSGALTGLDWDGTAPARRMLFWNSALPPAAPMTYLFKVFQRAQVKFQPDGTTLYRPDGNQYYTTFFRGNNGRFDWGTGWETSYYGCHPYPVPSTLPNPGPGRWEISVDAADLVTRDDGSSPNVVNNAWYNQAVIVQNTGGSSYQHRFYINLPSVATVNRLTYTRSGITTPPSDAIVMGQAPDFNGKSWGGYDDWEEQNAIIRGIIIFSSALTEAQAVALSALEYDSDVLAYCTANGLTSALWFLNMNPTPTDVTDKSGKGHHGSWDGTSRPALYTTGGASAPASSSGDLPSFNLLRATAGTAVPFALGQVFVKGAVPAGAVIALSTSVDQITPINSWDDGSVKMALIAGKADLSANTSQAVAVQFGTPTSGSALNEASLIAAAPTATVSYGAAGTVSLASLLGTSALVITEHAGPVYAAFQYIANFPSDATLRAVFYVQLWQGGAYRVRVAVEFGQAGNGFPAQSSKSGTATVTIAGAQVLSQAITMLTGNRWDAVGSSFVHPGVTHDVAYIRRSKLVPNYSFTNPSATALNALPTTYSPLALLHYEANMGSTGYAEPIGPLPHWDVMYLVTGDSRARDSAITHARAFGCYGIFLRDTTTKRMPKYSDWPTAYSGNEDYDQQGAGGYRWEFAHHPNAGYLAWLMTGERFFLETIHANAWACYHTNSGSTANRIYTSQTRGRAWRTRTISAAAAVSPTGDPIAADCRANLAANYANWKTSQVDTNTPGTGLVGIYDDKEADPGFQHSIFESLFMTTAIGWSWDMEPGFNTTQKANHLAVRDFIYKTPVGLTGRGQPTFAEFSWRRAPGPYRMNIGSSSALSSLYNTWDEVYDATYGDALVSTAGQAILESYADDPSQNAFPQGNWGHVITSLSYACDHSAANAQRGMDLVLGASNWNANATKFNDWPQYGVLPRVPAWYGNQASGTWKNLGSSFLSALGAQLTQGHEFSTTAIFSYSGGAINNSSFYDRNGVKRVGASGIFWGGGHQAYGGNEMVGFRLYDQTWYRIRDSFNQTVGPDTNQSLFTYSDGTPGSAHTYQGIAWCPRTNELIVASQQAIYNTGSSGRQTWAFSFNNPTPNGAAPGPWTSLGTRPDPGFFLFGYGDAMCYDSVNNRMVVFNSARYRASYFNPDTRAWTQAGGEGASSPIAFADRMTACYIPTKNWVLVHATDVGGGEPSGVLVADMAAGTPSLATTTGTNKPSNSAVVGSCWDPVNGRVVLCNKAGQLWFATPPATIGSSWTWTIVNPGGDTPDSQTWSGEGVWGRFGYVDDGVIRGYLLTSGPGTRPCFYKL